MTKRVKIILIVFMIAVWLFSVGLIASNYQPTDIYPILYITLVAVIGVNSIRTIKTKV